MIISFRGQTNTSYHLKQKIQPHTSHKDAHLVLLWFAQIYGRQRPILCRLCIEEQMKDFWDYAGLAPPLPMIQPPSSLWSACVCSDCYWAQDEIILWCPREWIGWAFITADKLWLWRWGEAKPIWSCGLSMHSCTLSLCTIICSAQNYRICCAYWYYLNGLLTSHALPIQVT